MKSGSVSLLESSGPVQGCNGIAVRFVCTYFILNISIIILSVGQIATDIVSTECYVGNCMKLSGRGSIPVTV